MKKYFFSICLLIILSVSTLTCSSNVTGPGERTGAICNDGTTTTATGSGACSHHGGVKEWLYK